MRSQLNALIPCPGGLQDRLRASLPLCAPCPSRCQAGFDPIPDQIARDAESAYSTFSSTFSKMISWPSAFLVGAEVRVSLLPEIAMFLFWVVPVQSSCQELS